MSMSRTPLKARDTVFCEGNEKELYPVKYGRRRESAKIFREHGYDPQMRSTIDKEVPKPVKQRSEIVEARNLYRGEDHIDRPQRKGKGAYRVDILEHSTNEQPYGFKTSKRAISPKDALKFNQLVLSEVKSQRPTDSKRENRLGKYMHSSGVKDLLTLPDTKYYKGLLP